MQWLETVHIAITALTGDKLRTGLTMLGIVIGIAATIALMAMGRGIQQYVTDQVAGLGSNLLFITAKQPDDQPQLSTRRAQPLRLSDVEALNDPLRLPDVAAVAGEYAERATVSRAGNALSIDVRGVTPEFSAVHAWPVGLGEFLTYADSDERTRVAVLGFGLYTDLFTADEYPLGQTVQIGGIPFRVIGVMEERGGGPGGDLDRSLFVPLTTAHDRLFRGETIGGELEVGVIYVAVVRRDRMDAAQATITAILRERRNIAYLDDNFTVLNQSELITVFGNITGTLTLFLGALAGISLLVGGIGIMNIMLVSVTERTYEIGLRKAVGAKRRDILLQFLVEAIALALCGGLLGVLLGVVGAQAVNGFIQEFQAIIDLNAVVLALLVSFGVGLFFGIYPAYQASRLNPIEALRNS